MPPWDKYKAAPASEGPWSKYGGASASSDVQAPVPPQASLADKMVGGWGGRMALGAASPILAATQMLGGEKGRAAVAELEAMKQRGMAAEGKDGFDFYGLLGSMAPGTAIAKGVTAAAPAASAMGKILQGAGIGAATSAAQPVASPDDFWADKGKQVAGGAAVGAVAPAIGAAISGLRGKPQLNPTQAETLAEGQKAGYVVSPSTVNLSFLNEKLESIAGKAAVGQEAAKRNQDITNALVAKELGLPKGTSLTEASLSKARESAGKTYEEVEKLKPPDSMEWFPRFHDKDLFQQLKKARADANLAYKSNAAVPHPDMLARAEALSAKADSIDADLEAIAKASGKEGLINELAKARTQFAKSYEYERALNIGDENISAPKIGALLNKEGLTGKTGATATIGRMQQAFPSVMREGAKVPVAGVSGTDAAASALLSVAGGAGMGPAGILAGGLPLLRGPARNLALSPAYQKFATADPAEFNALISALAQRTSGAAGTAVGRAQ